MNSCLLNSFLVNLLAGSLEINLENDFFYNYYNDFRKTFIAPILQDLAKLFVKKVNGL